MDISSVFVFGAGERCPDFPFVRADAGLTPFRKGSFDGLICECVIFLVNMPQALQEYHRALDGEGVFIVSDMYDLSSGGAALPGSGPAGRWEIEETPAGKGLRATHFEATSSVPRESTPPGSSVNMELLPVRVKCFYPDSALTNKMRRLERTPGYCLLAAKRTDHNN